MLLVPRAGVTGGAERELLCPSVAQSQMVVFSSYLKSCSCSKLCLHLLPVRCITTCM